LDVAGAVVLDDLAGPVKVAELGFGRGVTLPCRRHEPSQSLLGIWAHAFALDLHVAKRKLRGGMVIGRGKPVDADRVFEILSDAGFIAAGPVKVGNSYQ